MGTMIVASCDCGYTKKTSLGGSKISRGSNMPYCCRNCNQLVTVDESANDEPLCPDCGSSDVVSYVAKSKTATSRHDNLTGEELKILCLHKRKDEAAFNYPDSLLKSGNFCPNCKTMSLRFNANGSFS
jgi:RNA polymerase subunit RPABC4/transcription elongation factor Spt4